MEAAFACVPKSGWPFAGNGVAFVPDVFFCPKPACTAHSKDEFEDVGRALAVFAPLLDIDDQGAVSRQYPPELRGSLQPPFDIAVSRNSPVSRFSGICIGRGSHDQIDRGIFLNSQHL